MPAQSLLPLDLGVGPIVAPRHLLVPFALFVFPGNAARLPRHVLFGGGALRRAARGVMGGESLGKNAVDLIGPAVIMLVNAINDLCM